MHILAVKVMDGGKNNNIFCQNDAAVKIHFIQTTAQIVSAI